MKLSVVLTVTLPVMALCYALYFRFRRRRQVARKICAKCGATLMGVTVAVMGCIAGGANPLASLLCWGAALCMLGDGLLEVHFVSGMGAFALGHVCLIAWILRVSGGVSWLAVPLWAAAYIVALLAFGRYLNRLHGAMHVAFLLYPLVLIGMAAVAALLPLRLGLRAATVAVGGVLFAVSDLFVAKGVLDTLAPAWDRFALAIYYAGIYCLALGAWLLG